MNTKNIVAAAFLLLASHKMNFAQSIEEGAKFYDQEQFSKSIAVFNALSEKNPSNATALFYLGENYYKIGKSDSARIFYNRGIQSSPNEPLNYIGLAKLSFDENKPDGAEYLKKAQPLVQGKLKPLLAMVTAHLTGKNKNASEAMVCAEEAKKISPTDPYVSVALGDAFIAKADGGNAVTSYEKSIELNKTFALGFCKIGEIYVMGKSYDEAEKNFLKSIEVDPEFKAANRFLAELYYQKKQYAKAADYYKTYLDKAGNVIEAQKRYASFLFLNKKYAETIQTIEALKKEGSITSNLQRFLAYSYYETGNFPVSLTAIESYFANTSKPTATDYEYYGKILSKNASDSLAILNFRKALQVDAEKLDVHNSIADVYFNQKKYVLAADEYQAKFSKLKGAPSAIDLFELGRSYYYGADYVKADTTFAMVIAKTPESPLGYLWRGRAASSLDPETETGIAKPFYEGLITKATDPVKYKKELIEAYSYMGYYHYQKKDNASAKSFFIKVKELDPANQKALDVLKALK